MWLEPIGDKLLIQPKITDKKTTESGIYLPDSAKDKPQIGTVISVGAGRILENGTRMPLIPKVGDEVLFSKFAGTEIHVDGDENLYLLITERDVLCVIHREAQS